MRVKLNINAKMLVYILTTSIVIFALSFGYISLKTKKMALDNANSMTIKVAQENAMLIEKELAEDLAVLRTLAQAFTVYEDMEEQEWKELFLKMYYKVYEKNPNIYKLWDSWELKYFDSSWTKDYGRYAVNVYRVNNEIHNSSNLRSQDGDNELYSRTKSISLDMLWEPYWDAFLQDGEQQKFMTSLSSPIYYNGEFAGIVAADIIMDRFQKIVERIMPYSSTIACLTSNSGVIVAHPNNELIGKSIIDYAPQYENQFKLSSHIRKGKSVVFKGVNNENKKVLLAVAPIQVGDYKAPWALTIEIPVKVVLKQANKTQAISLIIAFIGVLLISLIIFIVTKNMSVALVETTDILKKLSKGDTKGVEDLIINRGDEIEEMANSVNVLKSGLKDTSIFAEQIGKGNLDAKFNPLSDKDILGNALLEMRKSLQHADAEENKRKIEDEKQNWATKGLAKFGEILRDNSNNIDLLSFNIMSNLITYIEVNQGALFIIEDTQDDDKFMEMKTAIAYGRDKFMKKRIAVGDELIGRCAFEQKTIYITDIPENYINITSGMGTANPTALLLVPLILNDEIFGVIEIASFHAIDDYKIEFIEHLGESIASTIATVKVNETTSKLLNQSKGQAEELAAQEEEMRQNLEELQATQEEAARREYEMAETIKALGATAFVVEYDIDGTILSCNDKYVSMLGMSQDEIVGQSHQEGYDFDTEMKANYDLFWGDLKRGVSKKEVSKMNHKGKEFWIEETYTPIISQADNKTYKILKIGFDITKQKLKEISFQEQSIDVEKDNVLLSEYKDKIEELQNELKQQENKITEKQVAKNVKKEAVVETDIKVSDDNLLDWVDDFEMSIDEIDGQHKQLITLANMVYSSFIQSKNKKEIKDNLKSFIDFASYHFGKEEQYFEQFDYADATNHILEHKDFLKKIKQFQEDYTTKKSMSLNKMMDYIKDWLFNHLTSVDSKYKGLFE